MGVRAVAGLSRGCPSKISIGGGIDSGERPASTGDAQRNPAGTADSGAAAGGAAAGCAAGARGGAGLRARRRFAAAAAP